MYITSFVLITVSICSTYGLPFDTMQWKPGDLISCPLPGLLGYFGNHFMLAVNEDQIIHVIGNRVLLQHRSEVCQGAITKSRCKIANSYGPEAVERAKNYAGVCVPYNLWTCNCQHYAMFWALNKRPSEEDVDSLSEPSSRCLRTDVEEELGYCPSEVNIYTAMIC